jgi:hypothetical protein
LSGWAGQDSRRWQDLGNARHISAVKRPADGDLSQIRGLAALNRGSGRPSTSPIALKLDILSATVGQTRDRSEIAAVTSRRAWI